MIATVLVLWCAGTAAAGEGEVTVGSPASDYVRNAQNEPAMAYDPMEPRVLAAGANDLIDSHPCAGAACNPTPGVGTSGIYFSFDGGETWIQPEYQGLSARTGVVEVGPIGTVPNYHEAGLWTVSDPWLAFGPRPGDRGFDWANGSRLYYATLAGSLPGQRTIRGGGVAVSTVDDLAGAAAGDATAWSTPVIVTHQNNNQFQDKEAIWVDNAASSPHFGTVYVCDVDLRPHAGPMLLSISRDGGRTWRQRQISEASLGGARFRLGCVLRTDSHGVLYLLWSEVERDGQQAEHLARSFNGGRSFQPPRRIAAVTPCGGFDPVQGRATFDGIAGTRTTTLPSIDIANGAPTGDGATDQIVITWCDARRGLDREQALVTTSRDRGETWSDPVDASAPDDRPDCPAVAISPAGTDLYLTYDAFLQPWQPDTTSPRLVQGVVRHADVLAGAVGAFSDVHRGAPGDARATSRQLNREFIYDYNSVVATPDGVVALWMDARNAAVCPVVNEYRQSLLTASPLEPPSPALDCPAAFGNADIYAGTFADPTP